MVDAEYPAEGVQDASRVKRARQGQVGAGRVGKPGDLPAGVGGGLRADGRHHTGGADRDRHVPRAHTQAEGGSGVVPGARADQRPVGEDLGSAGGHGLRRPEHAREVDPSPEREFDEVAPVAVAG